MEKKWSYLSLPTAQEVAQLQASLPTSSLTTHLLLQRNIQDFESAKAFFNPNLANLHDPWLMRGMQKAVKKIIEAIQQQQHIRIYGDYDVDGTTSVALFYQVLKKIGGKVSYYIPDRYQEGYGISQAGISQAIEDQVDLLVCVDCGTRAIEQLQRAYQAKIEVIVCDHHEPGDHLPPVLAMLNPKQTDCPYPFRELSACGIVFKVLQALIEAMSHATIDLTEYLDLVVLSIAADIVPIVDENRILAHHGLLAINQKSSLGITTLKQLSRPNQQLVISDLVFGLAPYINAAGRIKHAHAAVALLITSSEQEAKKIALRLQTHNSQRKKMDKELIQEALATIQEEQLNRASTVLLNEKWSKGLVGIGAARCIEHYYRPTILLTKEGEQAVGSARSVKGYNIYQALQKCEKLLTRYGGHAYAAGLSLPYSQFFDFKEAFEKVVNETWPQESRGMQQVIDIEVKLADLQDTFCNTLKRMRPFGPGNHHPVFVTQPVIATRHIVYQNKHLSLTLKDHTSPRLWHAIGFNMASYLPIVVNQKPFAMAYRVEEQTYEGRRRKQLIIQDLKPFVDDPIP